MANKPLHKAALIDTAVKLFRQKGYASTGLNQILEESGAPKGSLYHYFPDGKESLGEAAIVKAGEKVANTLTELAETSKTTLEFLKRYCSLLSGWMEDSGFTAGCPVATTLLETTPASERIRLAGAKVMNDWIDIIAGVCRADGLSASEARQKAMTIICAVEGALILCRVQMNDSPIKQIPKQLSGT